MSASSATPRSTGSAPIYGVAIDSNMVALDASVEYNFGAGAFSVGYIGLLGDATSSNGIKATLSWGF